MELTVLSSHGLRAFNFFQKLSPYAAVSIVSDPEKSDGRKPACQRQKMPVGRAGNWKPEWNHSLSFDLGPYKSSSPPSNKYPEDFFVRFEVRCKSRVFGTRMVGEVLVPLGDLVRESSEAPRFLSYQVRTSDGRSNGVLNFSYRVTGKFICTKTSTEDHKFEATFPSPGVQDFKNWSPEAVPVKPKDISYPSIDIDDIRSPSLVPPILTRQTVPYGNVFYTGNYNRQDAPYYKPCVPVPVAGHGPGQYPSKTEVTGYSYYL